MSTRGLQLPKYGRLRIAPACMAMRSLCEPNGEICDTSSELSCVLRPDCVDGVGESTIPRLSVEGRSNGLINRRLAATEMLERAWTFSPETKQEIASVPI